MSDHNLEFLKENDIEIYNAIKGEEQREFEGIELIPSENYTYPEVLAANGSILTNKYSEGYPGRRYYGGQEFTDQVENLARDRAKELFRCEHANVQALSGSPMNQAVYFAFMEPGDPILAMDLSHGGHLTHGAPVSHMGRIFNFTRYKTNPDDEGKIDFDHVLKVAKETKPKIVLCGYTSYPRDYDYQSFKDIADEVGAIAMADVSHVGGLIAGGAMSNPFDYGFDIVTTTAHKTLRGPRAGIVLCKKKYAKIIDKAVFPGLQGGPHMHCIAAIAVTLKKALQPEFKEYAENVMKNSKKLAESLMAAGCNLVTGGTDNHMMVMNTVESFGLNGTDAEHILDQVKITTNKQVIPDDPNPPLKPSGIRLGTPAATTRGMGLEHMEQLSDWMVAALKNSSDNAALDKIAAEVTEFCKQYPVPGVA